MGYDVFDSLAALELYPKVLTLTPRTLYISDSSEHLTFVHPYTE